MKSLRPGQTVGILGGGQLGRMLAGAAQQLGLKVHIYSPDPDSPAFDITSRTTVAEYTDTEHLTEFAQAVDVITYEFENIPVATAEHLKTLAPVFPDSTALAVTQDRLHEKKFIQNCGLKTAKYLAIDTLEELCGAMEHRTTPAILKTRRWGYDGKGQIRLSAEMDLEAVWQDIGQQPCILEEFVAFEKEISCIIARDHSGQTQAFEICENEHRNHILHCAIMPARISAAQRQKAMDMATTLVTALEYTGVMAIEMFATDHEIIINEIAPRVHNSGHGTLDGCSVSQFEQHIRAICGWPLARPELFAETEMINLIGDDSEQWADILSLPETCLHLYGKSQSRPGRKMGHITKLKPLRHPSVDS